MLDSPRIEPPPKTLEEARNAPGRAEQIAEIAERIEREGIEYVFFQQVSISGHINGKGVVAELVPAGRRARLPARLRRHRRPVHRPPGQLHRLRAGGVRAGRDRRPRHVRGAALGRAGRPGLLRLLRHRDRRAARRRPAPEPEADRRTTSRRSSATRLPDRDRAGDDVDEAARGRLGARGRHQALLLPHQPVRAAASGDPRRRLLRQGDGARHELRRPRGRPRPARAQLPLRPGAAHRRQHHHLPSDLRRGRPQPRPARLVHAEAVHRRLRQRAPPPLHPRRRRGQQRLPRPRRAGAALRDRAALHGRDPRPLRRPGLRRLPDRQLLQADVGLRLLGPGLQELRLAEPHLHGAGRERRALRVPRRRLLLQPLPDPGRAADRRASTGCKRELDPGQPQQANTYDLLAEGAEFERVPDQPRRRARGAGGRRGGPRRDAGPPLRRLQATTSATSGSATWRRSPTGSARSTWRSCPEQRADHVRDRRDHLPKRRRRAPGRARHDPDAAGDEAPRARLDRLRALPRRRRHLRHAREAERGDRATIPTSPSGCERQRGQVEARLRAAGAEIAVDQGDTAGR